MRSSQTAIGSQLTEHRCGMGTAAYLQLLEDVAHVVLDGLVSQTERRTDLLVGLAVCDQSKHPFFLRR
jgi:hypothetical protein